MNNKKFEEGIKSSALRPLADKFQELTRQIDSGEYELPKTIKEAESIVENYIDQAWLRIESYITKARQDSYVKGWRNAHKDIHDSIDWGARSSIIDKKCGCIQQEEENN